MNRHPDDTPILLKNEQEWTEFWKKLDEIEDITHCMTDPPLDYPCFVYYRTDYSDWNGYENDLYCYFFYIEDARELYAAKFLGE